MVTRGSLLRAKLGKITSSNGLVLFMKGTPGFPLCGLSANVCFWLKKRSLQFRYIDVLKDPELHLFLREIHAPSSVPYLYVDGKFVGGYDEIEEMFEIEGSDNKAFAKVRKQ